MVNKYSRGWGASSKSRMQRKARRLAPLHIRERLLRSNLSKELGDRYNANSMPIRVGDKIKIMKGDNKGKISNVSYVDHVNLKIYLSDVKVKKADGKEVGIPFQPCNLQIVSLALEDKKRLKSIERKKKKETSLKAKAVEEAKTALEEKKVETKKTVKAAEKK